MTYEIQFVDGFGAWRRWSLVRSAGAAGRSRARCAAFLGDGARVRIVQRSVG